MESQICPENKFESSPIGLGFGFSLKRKGGERKLNQLEFI